MFVDTLVVDRNQAIEIINQAWEMEVANTSSKEDIKDFMEDRTIRLQELEETTLEELQGLLDEWFQQGDFLVKEAI